MAEGRVCEGTVCWYGDGGCPGGRMILCGCETGVVGV